MGNKDMARMPRQISIIGLMMIFLVFLGAGVLSFSPAYGGPETMGWSPDVQSGVRAPRDVQLGVEEEIDEDTGKDDADVLVMATNKQFLPMGLGEVNVSDREATPFRQQSGFDAFNARYQNKWAATFSTETGKVRVLYGTVSKQYKNGPEGVARGFLKDSYALFGLRQDLSDLTTKRVDRTPIRDHVRMQQTYNGVPIDGVFVLVHATPQGRVTMVQNGYQEGFQPANGQVIAEEAAAETARTDLQGSLGKAAILAEPKAEQLIAPYKGGYYYIWRVAISTQNPLGLWVYRIDAESGAILYKANEILSIRSGKGRVYKSNADWHLPKISTVTLSNMYSLSDGNMGFLWGVHADIYDYNGSDPHPADYKFLYDPVGTQKPWFDATHAYYQMNTIWNWWNTKIIKIYYGASHTPPAYFSTYSIPTIVNVSDMCDAFYTSDIDGAGNPGFAFGDEHTCLTLTVDPFDNEDFVIDNDVVRHEFTHAIMNWSGFDDQFGGDVNNYGRAMGEGNADWFAFLNTPDDPWIGDVAFAGTLAGYLRDLDNTRMYPRDVDCTTCAAPLTNLPEEHYTGEIWGGYLYDLYHVLKDSARGYVYNSFFYFNTRSGHRDGYADFYDGIQAQMLAERDRTGGQTNTAKAWGSWASRGLNALFRAPYSHASDYFGTGDAGSDLPATFFWPFPPFQSVKTTGNILRPFDEHEYPITVTTTKARNLTVTVTAAAVDGAVNPTIDLYTSAGVLIASSVHTLTTALLSFPHLPGSPASYVIVVSGANTADAKGYYDLTLTLK
jgi:Zn-dependent metalloprotease